MSRDFSKVSPNLWDSKKFRNLPDDDARFCYVYLITNKHCNSAGCYRIRDGYASADLNWPLERYRNAIDSLCKGGLVSFDRDEETLLVENWVAFNEPTNAKHALGILNTLDAVSSETLKTQRIQEFAEPIERKKFDQDKQVGVQIQSLLKAYSKGILTETKTQTKRETKRDSIVSSVVARARSELPEPVSDPGAAPSNTLHDPTSVETNHNTTLPDLDSLESKLREAGGDALNSSSAALLIMAAPLSWIEGGADLDRDIVPAIRARSKNKEPASIGAWTYFTDVVRDWMRTKCERTSVSSDRAGSLDPTKFTDTDWSKRLRYFEEHEAWSEEWGARPGQPNCLVPQHLLSNADQPAKKTEECSQRQTTGDNQKVF